MRYTTYVRQFSPWGIPAIYAVVALAAGMTLPRIEAALLPDLVLPISVSSATAIYSSIAAGMISLTGIVFSLTFVMVQFSATAYSPRLVLLIARGPVMSHALGIFTANFLYAIAALVGIDRNGSGTVPFISAYIVVALLLASVSMFIVLIQRIGLLQVNQMLVFTGDQGRQVINNLYPPIRSAPAVFNDDDLSDLPCTQTLVHEGTPSSVQHVYVKPMVQLAKRAGAVIEFAVAVGDTVSDSMPLLQVFGAREPISEAELRECIELGGERTFDQDPKYAIRLLVDIAIRALSPAINDPTTAVQALDQIEDLLLRMGQRRLEIGSFRDDEGKIRLMVTFPTWEDLLRLAFDEICFYGGTSVQVMRRMNALIADLMRALPDERDVALIYWESRIKAVVTRSFVTQEERDEAMKEDRQGLGIPRQHRLARVSAA
jgi:uncharacterized membrane protein